MLNTAENEHQQTNGSSNSVTNGVTITTTALTSLNGGTAAMISRECANCGKRITERFLLKALDLFWHEDCLKCGCCDCRLGEVGSTLYTKANLILCKRDYLRLFGATGNCAACNKVIPAFEMVMRAKNNVYHLECFACQQCNHRFCVGDRFYLCENKILCEYDYEERLVFANMATYNSSSLAQIRRQPAANGNADPTATRNVVGHTTEVEGITSKPTAATIERCMQVPQKPQKPETVDQHQQQHYLLSASQSVSSIGGTPTTTTASVVDDGSSGYGSPDSETLLESTAIVSTVVATATASTTSV
ncbi:LIM domain transcription factor LMO4.1-like isoform X2 [Daktulosphaira vitifoliae]|uniref:LIM domain transcription factor LMO4.1-like isoform X2 n=1 Tax=Daktulosphaira vitifoliae TaxID=58002 RepID=UPI0021AAE1D5|nr:LIM domain transcription factor LMO4.1-like isoform X2 [Daktulosphaira vitifoliae]